MRKEFDWDLPEAIRNRLGALSYGNQRNIFEDGQLLMILHSPPELNQSHRNSVVFLRKKDGQWLSGGDKEGKAKLNLLLKKYRSILDTLEEKTDQGKKAKDYFSILEYLIPVNRAMKNLGSTLQEARKLVSDDYFLLEKRDQAIELKRNYEALLSDCRLALDFRIAEQAETQVEQANLALIAQHRLNLLAALTFPMMSFATIFGMNMVSGVEGRTPLLFWLVFLVATLVGIITVKWLNKK